MLDWEERLPVKAKGERPACRVSNSTHRGHRHPLLCIITTATISLFSLKNTWDCLLNYIVFLQQALYSLTSNKYQTAFARTFLNTNISQTFPSLLVNNIKAKQACWQLCGTVCNSRPMSMAEEVQNHQEIKVNRLGDASNALSSIFGEPGIPKNLDCLPIASLETCSHVWHPDVDSTWTRTSATQKSPYVNNI